MNKDMFIAINPAAQADISILNEILRSLPDYAEGISFTTAQDLGGNNVQFWYECSDEQAVIAQKLTSEAKAIFDNRKK